MNRNRKASNGLEYHCGSDWNNPTYVAGAPWGCSVAKDGIGVAAAFHDYHQRNRPDFFYVTWLVKKKKTNPPADWACRILFQVGSLKSKDNKRLNDLKLKVINAFQNSNVCSVLLGKGYNLNPGTKCSLLNIRSNKNTTLFTVILGASHSEETSDEKIKANIKALHDDVGERVEAVLEKLQLAKRLEKYFGS